MSQLAAARRQASSIRTLMRQGKYLPAIQVLRDTVLIMLKTPLMKTEREEFEKLIADGAYHIMSDQTVRKAAALEIAYTPGKERELLDSLRMLLDVFQEHIQQEAEEAMRQARERREQELRRGQTLLDASDVDGARGVFTALSRDADNDADLRADIGERFLRAGECKDAADYFGDAVALKPEAVHLYNSLAMAQRKLGRYAEAEQSYLKAAQRGSGDSHLLFNMGRLYVDWKKWDKALKAARGALALDPEFEEAGKLMVYVEKMLHKKT